MTDKNDAVSITSSAIGNDLEKNRWNRKPRAKKSFPRSVTFIISNEFCERFSFYGMKTILILYLMNHLKYSENTATMYFHIFVMACYFTPLMGAIVADSFLGRYWTILNISTIYAIGSIILAVAAIKSTIFLSFTGLLLIAIGTGGIKPCVSAFGADQFERGQEKQRQRFFSFFYMAINTGGLLSTFFTPILRDDVSCLGENDCFPLAFGIPAILMLISVCVFIIGRFTTGYTIIPPQRSNIIFTVFRVIFNALRGKFSSRSSGEPAKKHWLDYAEKNFDRKTIIDVKTLMGILFLYIPIPIFWTLFDQQSSRWTLQAIRLNGNLGFYTIKPDQIQIINPLLIVSFIPIFDYLIYPIGNKIGLNKPLRRMVVGGILAGLAFLACAFLEMRIENEQPDPMIKNYNHLMIINGDPTELKINITNITNQQTFQPFSVQVFSNVHRDKLTQYFVNSTIKNDQTLMAFYRNRTPYIFCLENVLMKPHGSNAKIFTIFNLENFLPNQTKFSATETKDQLEIKKTQPIKNGTEQIGLLKSFEYEVKGKLVEMTVNSPKTYSKKYKLLQGATYIQMITGDMKKNVEFNLTKVVNENQMSVLMQLFQYMIITAAEIMFSITGQEFAYSQAPKSMKSVIQAAWLLTVSFGDLLVAIIADIKLFHKQSYEFIFFAILMFADIALFAWMAYGYVPYNNNYNDQMMRPRISRISIEGELPIFDRIDLNEENSKNDITNTDDNNNNENSVNKL